MTDDIVLAYDPDRTWTGHTSPSTSGADIFRIRKGGYAMLAQACGQPGTNHRLHLVSNDSNDLISDVLYFEVGATSTCTNFAKGLNGSTEVFQLTKLGQMGLGRVFSGAIATGFLEVTNSIFVQSTGAVDAELILESAAGRQRVDAA